MMMANGVSANGVSVDGEELRQRARKERNIAIRTIMDVVELYHERETEAHTDIRRAVMDAIGLMDKHIVDVALYGSR